MSRRKKRTKRKRRRRGKRGGYDQAQGQPNFNQLKAMYQANPHRIYNLFIIDNNNPSGEQIQYSDSFIHRLKYAGAGPDTVIGITGHSVNNRDGDPHYTIPNDGIGGQGYREECRAIIHQFYDPEPNIIRRFNDNLVDLAAELSAMHMGGRRKRRKKRKFRRKKTKRKSRRRKN